MSERNETLADIRKEAEGRFRNLCIKHVELGCLQAMQEFNHVFDRIEAAAKRERAEVEANALAVGGVVEASRHKPGNAAARRKCATAEKSSVVGNSAAMREALEKVKKSIDDMGASSLDGDPEILIASLTQVCARLSARIDAALAKPPRNCDVGTAEEQQDRFREFCRHYESEGECGIGRSEAACPAFQGGRNPDCSLWWAHMPYEEGGAK